MMPEPTTAASKSAVPTASAVARRARFISAARDSRRRKCGVGLAARRLFVIALFGLSDNVVRLPAASIGIRSPDFILHRVAARFFGLDIDQIASLLQTHDRGV